MCGPQFIKKLTNSRNSYKNDVFTFRIQNVMYRTINKKFSGAFWHIRKTALAGVENVEERFPLLNLSHILEGWRTWYREELLLLMYQIKLFDPYQVSFMLQLNLLIAFQKYIHVFHVEKPMELDVVEAFVLHRNTENNCSIFRDFLLSPGKHFVFLLNCLSALFQHLCDELLCQNWNELHALSIAWTDPKDSKQLKFWQIFQRELQCLIKMTLAECDSKVHRPQRYPLFTPSSLNVSQTAKLHYKACAYLQGSWLREREAVAFKGSIFDSL